MKKLLLPLLLALTLLLSSCAHVLPQIPPSGLITTEDTVAGGSVTDPDTGEVTPSGTEAGTSDGTLPMPEPPAETSEGLLDPTDPNLPAEEDHTDENNDGECDDCGISVVIVLDLFAINDLHGKFADTSAQVGVDELTTYLKNAYATEDHVILLSSGDMWQGSSESNLTKGFIITEWMNDLDFVSMTLGNHEYDWGESFVENGSYKKTTEDLAHYSDHSNICTADCQHSVRFRRRIQKRRACHRRERSAFALERRHRRTRSSDRLCEHRHKRGQL